MEENRLTEAAMKVIMSAGDAREHCTEALQNARKGDFEAAEECMIKAKECIAEAHQGQTAVIQKEAAGEKQEICLLFVHAQDTLMTIMSELNMAKEIIEVYKLVYKNGR